MTRRFLAAALVLALGTASFSGTPADPTSPDKLEEVVVVGRLPGPPLWKISRGEHVLWILPLIGAYPKKMEWESARVEALIAQSQEYIERPRAYRGLSTSNPVTLVRLMRLAMRPRELPDGQKLVDVLPPELHQRFNKLQARYLPRDKDIERLRVSAAGTRLQGAILNREQLETLRYNSTGSPELITSKLSKWIKRNKTIRRTAPDHGSVHAFASGDVKLVSKAMEEVSTSAAFATWEVACLEKTLAYFEKDIEAVKKRANAWAQGRADDLIDPAPLHGRGDACNNPPAIPDGSPAMAKLRREAPGLAAMLVDDRSESERISRERWLAAAEAALARNTNTFSVLYVNDILDRGGLVSQLQAKGYTVEISASTSCPRPLPALCDAASSPSGSTFPTRLSAAIRCPSTSAPLWNPV